MFCASAELLWPVMTNQAKMKVRKVNAASPVSRTTGAAMGRSAAKFGNTGIRPIELRRIPTDEVGVITDILLSTSISG
jgi:hypothetical protein